jgi:hypothetical protein
MSQGGSGDKSKSDKEQTQNLKFVDIHSVQSSKSIES